MNKVQFTIIEVPIFFLVKIIPLKYFSFGRETETKRGDDMVLLVLIENYN